MAYPGGTDFINEHVASLIRNHTGIKYARTTTSTHNFDLQADLIMFNPTVSLDFTIFCDIVCVAIRRNHKT